LFLVEIGLNLIWIVKIAEGGVNQVSEKCLLNLSLY